MLFQLWTSVILMTLVSTMEAVTVTTTEQNASVPGNLEGESANVSLSMHNILNNPQLLRGMHKKCSVL